MSPCSFAAGSVADVFSFVRYRENPQIVAMTNLVTAYQHRDIFEAEKIIRSKSFSPVAGNRADLLLQITKQQSWMTPSSGRTSTTFSVHCARST